MVFSSYWRSAFSPVSPKGEGIAGTTPDLVRVARLRRLSRSTIYRMSDEGRIPKISLGRKIVRFREADITDLIENGARGGVMSTAAENPRTTDEVRAILAGQGSRRSSTVRVTTGNPMPRTTESGGRDKAGRVVTSWRRKFERTALYAGTCSLCGVSFNQGVQIAWSPGRGADHWKCYVDGVPETRDPAAAKSIAADRAVRAAHEAELAATRRREQAETAERYQP